MLLGSAACSRAELTDSAQRLRIHELRSEVFSNDRLVRVWLPEEYDETDGSATRYPVLYLNDGQNVFDSTTSVFNSIEWRADELVDSLVESGVIPPIIVVGIDNAGRSGRAREYLPYPDEFLFPPEPDPLGNRYGAFLRGEVFSLVDRLYRTEPSNRALGGSSYGALVALHAAVMDTNLVEMLLIESPSLYVDGGALFSDLTQSSLEPRRIYVGIGTNELGEQDCEQTAGNVEAVDDARRLAAHFAQFEATLTSLVIDDCAKHDEAAWARRFPHAVEFLFTQ